MKHPLFRRSERRTASFLSAFALAALFIPFSSSPFFGQNTVTGAFQGRVADNLSDTPIPGASVTITNERTGTAYTLVTDGRGEFFQGQLAPGSYLIRIEAANYRSKQIRMPLNITRTGEVVPVPVTLEAAPPGVVTTPAVPTNAEDDVRVGMNTVDARRDDSYPEEKLAALPIGSQTVTRTLDELALLSPGVAPPPQTIGDVAGPGVGPGVGSAGQFAVNGIRSRANNFTVDGSDNNDEDIGVRRQGFVALSSQPVESVQEFQIITLLATAQFGRNIGAQVNLVSKTGGANVNGSVYGYFNSDRLNARNYFDTIDVVEQSPLRSASGQPVLLDGQPFILRNNAGGENPFTAFQGGATLGGPLVKEKLFYFLAGEYQRINATQEKHFAVPTVEQRGPFGTGATGIFRNPFTIPNAPISAIPEPVNTSGIFGLYPFPNDPSGIFGPNTYTRSLPASAYGAIFSGRVDHNSEPNGRPQSFTVRYNFTDDRRDIPAVDEALFASVQAKVRTHNLSLFLNNQLSSPGAEHRLANQVRFSIGRTRLNFDEIRDTEFLAPSDRFPDEPFLLNARARFNVTTPPAAGVPNTGPVQLITLPHPQTGQPAFTELITGPLGQVRVGGFSSLGTDVYNFPQTRTNTTFQIADELAYRTNDHAVVVGADIRRTTLDSDLPRLARPLLTFNGGPRLIPAGNGFRFPTSGDPDPILSAVDYIGMGAASDFLVALNVDRPDSEVALRFYQLNFYGQDTWRVRPNFSLSYGLRYEYNTPLAEENELIEASFSDPRLSVVPGLQDFIDGRSRLHEPDLNNFAPRVGFAYSPDWFGSSRTSVIRAGYGLFYDQILGAVANQSRNVFPTFLTLNFGGLQGAPNSQNLQFFVLNPLQSQAVSRQGSTVDLTAPNTLNLFNPAIDLADYIVAVRALYPNAITATLPASDLKTPMAHHYSVTYEQQLSRHIALSIGYAGTYAQSLLRFETPNLGSSSSSAPTVLQLTTDDTGQVSQAIFNGRRLNPNRALSDIGAVMVFSSNATSSYNSLQSQLRTRLGDRFDMRVFYTLANARDEVSDVFDLAGASALPQDSFDLEAERGPANFDVRHQVGYSLVYHFSESGGGNWLTKGLQLSSSGQFHSGQPFTVNSILDVNLDGNLTDRLDTLSGLEVTGEGSQPLLLQTANTLSLLAPFGQDGRIGRNSFRGGKLISIDVSAAKAFSIGSQRVSIRADIFNVFNRANFGIPVRYLEAPGFGRATNTVTPARRIQFSLRYSF